MLTPAPARGEDTGGPVPVMPQGTRPAMGQDHVTPPTAPPVMERPAIDASIAEPPTLARPYAPEPATVLPTHRSAMAEPAISVAPVIPQLASEMPMAPQGPVESRASPPEPVRPEPMAGRDVVRPATPAQMPGEALRRDGPAPLAPTVARPAVGDLPPPRAEARRDQRAAPDVRIGTIEIRTSAPVPAPPAPSRASPPQPAPAAPASPAGRLARGYGWAPRGPVA